MVHIKDVNESSSRSVQLVKKYYEDGLVTETVISYKGVDDILVTRLDNPDDHTQQQPWIVESMMEDCPKTGHSIISEEPYTRKYWWASVNDVFYNDYELARPSCEGLGKMDIFFPIFRFADMVESVKVFVPEDAQDNGDCDGDEYDVTVAVVKKLVARCPCRDPNLYQQLGKSRGSSSDESITVKFDEPVELVGDAHHMYYTCVTVPYDVFADWAWVRTSVSSVYMCNPLRDLLRDAPLKWHELECCPRKAEEQCDIELMTNLYLHRRVDKFPSRPEAAESDGSSGVKAEADADDQAAAQDGGDGDV